MLFCGLIGEARSSPHIDKDLRSGSATRTDIEGAAGNEASSLATPTVGPGGHTTGESPSRTAADTSHVFFSVF